MLYGSYSNYYQPTSYNTSSYNPYSTTSYNTSSYNPYGTTSYNTSSYNPYCNTSSYSNLYSGYQTQSYSTMSPQYSYTNQNYGLNNYSSTGSSSNSFMLLNILSSLISFLPALLGTSANQTASTVTIPTTTATTNTTTQPVNFFQKMMQEFFGLSNHDEKEAEQNTKIDANTTAIAANEEVDAAQETEITANAEAIAANDAKDVTQDTEIADLKTQIAELKELLAQNTAKDATQDTQIAAGVAKDAAQDSKIATVESFNSKTESTFNTWWNYSINSQSYINRDPLTLDTNKDGKVSTQAGIGVDLDDDGQADGAAVDGDKMLAMSDLNNNGKIDASEVFGTDTINAFTGEKVNARNGFEALKEIAESAEEKTGIDVIDDEGIVNLVKLQEALKTANVNLGLISDDNVTELEDLGDVEKIDLKFEEETNELNTNKQVSSYITKSGEKFKTEDVWFAGK